MPSKWREDDVCANPRTSARRNSLACCTTELLPDAKGVAKARLVLGGIAVALPPYEPAIIAVVSSQLAHGQLNESTTPPIVISSKPFQHEGFISSRSHGQQGLNWRGCRGRSGKISCRHAVSSSLGNSHRPRRYRFSTSEPHFGSHAFGLRELRLNTLVLGHAYRTDLWQNKMEW